MDDDAESVNEFSSFEDLTKQLLQVKKADLDQARQQENLPETLLIPEKES